MWTLDGRVKGSVSVGRKTIQTCKKVLVTLNLNKKEACTEQYGTPPPDDGMWDQKQEQPKAKQQLQVIGKSYFYKDIDSDDKLFRMVPSLLPNQLSISLNIQVPRLKKEFPKILSS